MTTTLFIDSYPDLHGLPWDDLAKLGCRLIVPSSGPEELHITLQDGAEVVFIHARDDAAVDFAMGKAVLENGSHVAYYSGDDHQAREACGSLRGRHKNKTHLCHRVALDVLTREAVDRVSRNQLPALWEERPRASRETLAALALLCQGFLAAQAVKTESLANLKESKGWGPPEISDVLLQMGWVDLVESEAGSRWRSVSDHAARVADPAWWRSVVGPQREDLVASLETETEGEYHSRLPLKRLVDAIYGVNVISAHTVSGAYRCLTDLI